MENCAICSTQLKFSNTPLAGGVLAEGNKLCRHCCKKLNKVNPSMLFNLKKYTLADVKSEINNVSSHPKNGISKIGIAIILAVILIIGYAISGGEKEVSLTAEQKDSIYSKRQEITARTMATEFIKQILKAPSTAEFSESKIWYLKDSTFMVKGYVDSQNSFGAMLRSVYECKVKQVDKDNWIVLHRELL